MLGDETIVLGHIGRATTIGELLAFLSARAKAARARKGVAHWCHSFQPFSRIVSYRAGGKNRMNHRTAVTYFSLEHSASRWRIVAYGQGIPSPSCRARWRRRIGYRRPAAWCPTP